MITNYELKNLIEAMNLMEIAIDIYPMDNLRSFCEDIFKELSLDYNMYNFVNINSQINKIKFERTKENSIIFLEMILMEYGLKILFILDEADKSYKLFIINNTENLITFRNYFIKQISDYYNFLYEIIGLYNSASIPYTRSSIESVLKKYIVAVEHPCLELLDIKFIYSRDGNGLVYDDKDNLIENWIDDNYNTLRQLTKGNWENGWKILKK